MQTKMMKICSKMTLIQAIKTMRNRKTRVHAHKEQLPSADRRTYERFCRAILVIFLNFMNVFVARS